MNKRAYSLKQRRLGIIPLYFLLVAVIFSLAFLGNTSVTSVRAQTTASTWYVQIGGTLPGFSTDQAMGFFPGVVVVDAGDTVVWTNVASDAHTVTFTSGARPLNPFAPGAQAPIPCPGPSTNTYNGTGTCSSGILTEGQQYSLTFTKPGVYLYYCILHAGMVGVVVVQPRGATYPYTQTEYNAMASQEQSMFLNALQSSVDTFRVQTSTGANNTLAYTIANGWQGMDMSMGSLRQLGSSGVSGMVTAMVMGPITVQVNLTLVGLKPNEQYTASLYMGSSVYGEAEGYQPISLGGFTASSANYTTSLMVNASLNIPMTNWLVLPSSGLYVTVYSGSNQSALTPVATGDIADMNGGIMGFLPKILTITAGDTVTWVDQNPNEVHTVTFLAPGMQMPEFGTPITLIETGNNTAYNPTHYYNSGPMLYGEKYTLTFNTPGVYTYECLIHDSIGMQGYIVVLPENTPLTTVVNHATTVQQQTTVTQNYSTTLQESVSSPASTAIGAAGLAFGLIALGVALYATRRK